MGRKETQCLKPLANLPMEKQITHVQQGLLKRNSLDSIDFLRQQAHGRNKSQQVRFKDDGTNRKQSGANGLEARPLNATSTLNGKAIRPGLYNLSNCTISFPRSKRALRNIAIQTSPSLRKHFPIFRKKILMTSKPFKEVSLEPKGCFQVNGNLCEPENTTSSELAKHSDDATKTSKKNLKSKRKTRKAHDKGPANICSELTKFLTLEKPSALCETHNHHYQNTSQNTDASICTTEKSIDPKSILSFVGKCQSSKKEEHSHHISHCNRRNLKSDFCEATKNGTEISLPNKHLDIKRTTTSLNPSLKTSLKCSHRDQHQSTQSMTKTLNTTLVSDNLAQVSFPASDENQTAQTSQSDSKCERDKQASAGTSEGPCLQNTERGINIKPHLSGNTSTLNTGKEIIQISQINLAPGEVCALKGKMKTVEQSLNSNQEKIKVLLNVIQDLEKARALNEGRNSYHTGQDINNCSTCQSTACIIYSVEYDFRKQEGRFHPVLKTLDQVEQNSVSDPVQKTMADIPLPEKKDIQRKAKKMKKKCFWWL